MSEVGRMMLAGKRVLDVIGSRQVVVAVIAAITGLYYLIVAVTNCADTDTNRRGVAAVLSMQHTIHSEGTNWRAITNSTVVLVVYILIVAWEYLIAFALLAGAAITIPVALGRTRQDSMAVAWKLCSIGWTMAIVLFLGGFLTIAGEWFRMWANKDVNASSAALQNFLIAAVGLILLHLQPSTASSISKPQLPES
ncbi:DUF2165 domain-containing protein [Nocardia sp. CDC160]|uniref:DUF2165 domain-containing protein n=1 Tax=Nocardia sp. CDC160 TaxID=3112166 RepID=UPI002DBC696B|nr:DUF2165 domain-containing protein [Nocardia sp. CDC160]MEC3919268.1 DUF2165 domain-containing protein [Nocardia sp. CDC160]